MSHQVLISFDIDENKVQENAEKEAGRQIAKEVKDRVFGDSYNADYRMRKMVESIVIELLEPQRDEIIAQAVKEVVGNLHKTKAVKEKLQETLQ